MLDDKLNQIGLNSSESKVYLELLKIGPQAVSVIAKRLGLNRSTSYSVLKSLHEKGLVASYQSNGMTIFVANDPNCLVSYLDRKCRTFDYYKTNILAFIPHFRSLKHKCDFTQPVVTFYEGVEGVKQVMYQALENTGDFCAYIPLDRWFDSGLKEFLLDYRKMRVDTEKVPLKAIASDTPDTRAFFEDNYDMTDGLTKILYVSPAHHPDLFENELNIFEDRVAILHLEQGNEYAVMIDSKEFADMQRAIFNLTWKGLDMEASI